MGATNDPNSLVAPTLKEFEARMRDEARERKSQYEHAKRVVENLRDEFED